MTAAATERLVDLLVQQVVEGLATEDSAELERLLATAGPDPGFEATAAAIVLAARLPMEPLPPQLRDRLVSDGRANVHAAAGATVVPLRRAAPAAPPRRRDWGWLAAAASILIAVAAWWPRFGGDVAPPAQPPVPAEPTLAALHDQVAAAPGALRIEWSATPDPAARGVVGDVVWDNVRQVGYMRFAGLAPNDPAREQYQLWVFDGARDERYPVDGGVFDIPAGQAEVIVPIRARLGVARPMLFAVTVEKPGGVVVSSRERIVVLAQAAST